MTDTKEKPKHSRLTWGTALMAFFAAITAISGTITSCNERATTKEQATQDRQQAVNADAARVKGDKDVQDTSKTAFTDLYDRLEELEALVEEQDRDLFELRVDNSAQDRIIDMIGGVSDEVIEMLTLEALASEARIENVYVDTTPTLTAVAEPALDVSVKNVAAEITEKKRKKRKKPKPEFDFAPPEPQYHPQQMIEQMLLPPRPGKKK